MAVDVERLYATHGPFVLRRCRRLLRHEAAAVDAMHDVFVQLLTHRHQLDEAHPAGLLHRLATNVCLNRLRTTKRRPEDQDDALVLSIAHHADLEARTDALGFLRRALGGLPESTATMAVLHHLDGMTYEEVAAETGLSVSGVRKRLRALAERVAELKEAP